MFTPKHPFISLYNFNVIMYYKWEHEWVGRSHQASMISLFVSLVVHHPILGTYSIEHGEILGPSNRVTLSLYICGKIVNKLPCILRCLVIEILISWHTGLLFRCTVYSNLTSYESHDLVYVITWPKKQTLSPFQFVVDVKEEQGTIQVSWSSWLNLI